MLKGDLTSTPLAPLLLELADSGATGCLVIHDPRDDEALVYLKAGLIYAVSVPGTRPQLGAKLVSSGALAPDALAEALEAQRSELQGWRLGELLVHLGYVEQPLVEAFVKEQVNEALWDLLRWNDGQWKFRKNIKAREDVGPPMTVVELLETLRDRGYEWEAISAIVHGPDAIPHLSTRGDGSQETTLDNDAWSMLCKIDGERSVADLARDCGYTLFEAGLIMVSLVEAGLVDIDEDLDLADSALYGATTLSSAFNGDLFDVQPADDEPASEDSLSRVARLVSEVARGEVDSTDEADETESPSEWPALTLVPDHGAFDNPMIVQLRRRSNESFAASIARVSSALSEVLGDAPSDDDAPAAAKAVTRRTPVSSTNDPEWQRRKRLRAAAAAELATAQALIETLRPGSAIPDPQPFSGEVPKVVSRATEERRAAERAVKAARELTAHEIANRNAEVEAAEAQRVAALAEADRLAAQAAAAAAEAERLADEVEAQRLAAAQAEREAEQAAAERLAEIARQEAEAQAQRLAAAEAERDRLAAEAETRRLAEAAEAAEAQRLAEAAEAQRLADEAEAARLAAEAEAQRLAEEAEAQRLADEAEAAEAAEAQRLADEAEAAEAAEAQRLADEAEAQRLADEAEAQRLADEAEAQRLADEAEAAEAQRLADEAEAQRLADEAEAARLAAEAETQAAEAAAEAQRQADEANAAAIAAAAQREAELEAQRIAAEEAARAEDDRQATAMLVELAATSEPPTSAPADFDSRSIDADTDDGTDAGEDAAEVPWSEAGQADTAALLRELSSLGSDSDGPVAPTTTRAPRTQADKGDKKAKKKIGLFGL